MHSDIKRNICRLNKKSIAKFQLTLHKNKPYLTLWFLVILSHLSTHLHPIHHSESNPIPFFGLYVIIVVFTILTTLIVPSILLPL